MLLRALSTLTLAAASVATLPAADPFAGTWKLNLAKSKFTGQQTKIEDLGQNRYKFTGGADSDTITADGTDQPYHDGTTHAVTMETPNVRKTVVKKDGKILSTYTWTLSADGKTMTLKGTQYKPDGTAEDYGGASQRIGSGTGWTGTWESTDYKVSSPFEAVISAYQGDGLSISYPAYKDVLNMKFDGKDYSENGPNVLAGSKSSGRRVNANTLEIADKIRDKVVDKATWKVSKDGKTLTVVAHNTGQPNAQTAVFDKQ